MSIPNKTEKELKELALDLFAGKVFTDRHIPEPSGIGMVFMVAGLGGLAEEIKFLKDHPDSGQGIGMIYEYLSEAGERSVNGLPSFMSCRLINKHDTEILHVHLQDLDQQRKQFLAGKVN